MKVMIGIGMAACRVPCDGCKRDCSEEETDGSHREKRAWWWWWSTTKRAKDSEQQERLAQARRAKCAILIAQHSILVPLVTLWGGRRKGQVGTQWGAGLVACRPLFTATRSACPMLARAVESIDPRLAMFSADASTLHCIRCYPVPFLR